MEQVEATINLRPEVQWFAEKLEEELAKGDDGGPYTDWWLDLANETAMRRCRAAQVELEAALISAAAVSHDDDRRLHVIELAVKVSSFLVMIASNWRPYPRPTPDEEREGLKLDPKNAEKRIAELESHIRNLAARVDGDGGHLQLGESIEATVERTDQNIVALKVAASESQIPSCKDGCDHWLGEHCDGTGMVVPFSNGSSFCSYHSRLQK